jgi:hypothetical protein
VLAGKQLPTFWSIATEATYPSVQTAPLVIVPLSSKQIYIDHYTQNAAEGENWADERNWPAPFWHIDTGMATLLILLTVVDEGLAACYFGIMAAAVERLRGLRDPARPRAHRGCRYRIRRRDNPP